MWLQGKGSGRLRRESSSPAISVPAETSKGATLERFVEEERTSTRKRKRANRQPKRIRKRPTDDDSVG